MRNNLKDFFNDNDVRIGEDYSSSLPEYYLSLHDALNHYFKTFRDNKDRYHFLRNIKSWERKDLAFNFTTSDNVVFTILSFHRFIELLLKDILRRIEPFLAVKFIEKEADLFDYFDGGIKADQLNTIEYSETLRRFKHAYDHYEKTSDVYLKHLKAYEFIIEDKVNTETLFFLSNWRNRIMHNGNKLPNILSFDYLISQRIIPLIDKIIKAESIFLQREYRPYYYQTITGINVIDKILEIKFDFKDFTNDKKVKETGAKLMALAHLKEIGRVSYYQDVFFRRNQAPFEPSYTNPIERSERFASVEKINTDFFKIEKCICCGINSLVVYKKEFKTQIFSQGIKWFKCYHCDYSLSDTMGEPKYFGLTETTFFDVPTD